MAAVTAVRPIVSSRSFLVANIAARLSSAVGERPPIGPKKGPRDEAYHRSDFRPIGETPTNRREGILRWWVKIVVMTLSRAGACNMLDIRCGV